MLSHSSRVSLFCIVLLSFFFFFSSRRRHTRLVSDWSSDVCFFRSRDQVDIKPRADDHPRQQRVVGGPTMAAVVGAVANEFSIDEDRVRNGRGGVARMIAAWIGWNEALLTNRDIAAGLRLRSSGYVSRLIRRCDRKLGQDPRLRRCFDR